MKSTVALADAPLLSVTVRVSGAMADTPAPGTNVNSCSSLATVLFDERQENDMGSPSGSNASTRAVNAVTWETPSEGATAAETIRGG